MALNICMVVIVNQWNNFRCISNLVMFLFILLWTLLAVLKTHGCMLFCHCAYMYSPLKENSLGPEKSVHFIQGSLKHRQRTENAPV